MKEIVILCVATIALGFVLFADLVWATANVWNHRSKVATLYASMALIILVLLIIAIIQVKKFANFIKAIEG